MEQTWKCYGRTDVLTDEDHSYNEAEGGGGGLEIGIKSCKIFVALIALHKN